MNWAPDLVRTLSMDDVNRYHRGWKTHPPLWDLIAGFVGWKPPVEERPEPASHPSIAMIKAMYPDGIVRG